MGRRNGRKAFYEGVKDKNEKYGKREFTVAEYLKEENPVDKEMKKIVQEKKKEEAKKVIPFKEKQKKPEVKKQARPKKLPEDKVIKIPVFILEEGEYRPFTVIGAIMTKDKKLQRRVGFKQGDEKNLPGYYTMFKKVLDETPKEGIELIIFQVSKHYFRKGKISKKLNEDSSIPVKIALAKYTNVGAKNAAKRVYQEGEFIENAC